MLPQGGICGYFLCRLNPHSAGALARASIFKRISNIEASDIRVQDIDHCGLIAGICDEIGLVEKLARILGTDPMEIVTPGQAVKAMILNGWGFGTRPTVPVGKIFCG